MSFLQKPSKSHQTKQQIVYIQSGKEIMQDKPILLIKAVKNGVGLLITSLQDTSPKTSSSHVEHYETKNENPKNECTNGDLNNSKPHTGLDALAAVAENLRNEMLKGSKKNDASSKTQNIFDDFSEVNEDYHNNKYEKNKKKKFFKNSNPPEQQYDQGKRSILSKEQRATLKHHYTHLSTNPHSQQLEAISIKSGLPKRVVQVLSSLYLRVKHH